MIEHILAKLVGELFREDNLSEQEPYDPDFAKYQTQFWQAIKLVDSDDLKVWNKFPKYQEHKSINYGEYQNEVRQLTELKDRYKDVFDDYQKLNELNSDEIKVYHSFTVKVPRSVLKRTKLITLDKPLYDNTVISVSDGKIENGKLKVQSEWSKNEVQVTYSCPVRDSHSDEIKSLQQKLSRLDSSVQDIIRWISESRFNHPVFFVSHRWEAEDHPDPNCTQLQKLRSLKNCFLIYDFASFPQAPLGSKEAKDLQLILKYMSKLIKKIIILNSSNYIDRGWCLYEYITSSLRGSVICDEIQDHRFVSLRNWASTRVQFPQNPFRDSWESMQQNYVNEKVLSAINEILPLNKNSKFTVNNDRVIVRELLLQMLKSLLPPRKIHQMYLGEWKEIPWTEVELANAFETELKWESQQTMIKSQFDMKVPQTIEEAVKCNYRINKDTTLKQSLF